MEYFKTRVAVATAQLFQAKMGHVEIFGFPCRQLLGAPFEPKMSFLGHSVPKLWPIVCFEGQKWPFLAKMGVDKSAFFSKTPSLNCLKMHHYKVLGSRLM